MSADRIDASGPGDRQTGHADALFARLAYILRHAEDRLVFVDAALLPRFCQLDAETLDHLALVVVCGTDDRPGGWQNTEAARALRKKIAITKLVDFDEFLAPFGHKPSFQWPEDLDELSACAMCYTSGTTGNPKGVLYSHRSTYLHTLAMPGKDFHNLGGADVLYVVGRWEFD